MADIMSIRLYLKGVHHIYLKVEKNHNHPVQYSWHVNCFLSKSKGYETRKNAIGHMFSGFMT